MSTKTAPIAKPPLQAKPTLQTNPTSQTNTTLQTNPTSQIIPNELKININTSVPGFQTIKYNSSMTIKDKDKNQVCFNPLVKLDKNIIDKIPEKIRISEFFNKGLFESLINTHGMTKEETLKEATNKGYVDNNIIVTLNTIFPIGSIIYINKEPYAIADIQWTKGDWRVDTKQKSIEIETSKITNPQMYANIIKDEIIIGEKQLQEITPTLLSGPSYTGPPIISIPAAKPTFTPSVKSAPTTTSLVVAPTPTALVPASTSLVVAPTTTSLVVAPAPTILALPAPPRVEIEEIKDDDKPELQIISKPIIERPPDCVLNIPRGRYQSTSLLQTYFGDNKYYNLVNQIFLRMNEEIKRIIRTYLSNSTTISIDYTVDTLSRSAYTQLIKGMRISRNEGGGNCFFIAVAEAINCYNHKYPGNSITSGIHGKRRINFTQSYLRELVYEYLISDKGNLQGKQVIVDAYKDGLNTRFLQELTERDYGTSNFNLTDNDYLALITNTYLSLPNFLVIKPTVVPNVNTLDYSAPFINSINVNDREQLRNYILSNEYWGDEESLNALCDILKINIITIHYNSDANNLNEQFRISSGNLLTTDSCDDWSKYLFLYESGHHYELITFTYITRIPSNSPKNPKGFVNSSETHVIFNNDYILLPPIFILFFIYGSRYFSRDGNNLDAKLLPNIFNSINNSFEVILRENDQNTLQFLTLFNSYFTSNKSVTLIETIERNIASKGGSNRFEKSEEKKDSSKICYYITIDMELQKGTSLSEEQLSDAKCRQKWNSVRKAFSNFTGKKYVIPPVYDYSKNKTQKQPLKTSENTKTNTNSITKNNNSYLNTNQNNGTRKYISQQGGKRNRTIKYTNKNKNK